MKVVINDPTHPHNGSEVLISHAGLNRHPHIDSGYGYTPYHLNRMSMGERAVAVIILGDGYIGELLDTIDGSRLKVVA